MKRKSNIRGFTLRGVAATLVSFLGLVALSISSKAASPSSPTRTLTFAERVAYQRAIEEVYGRHRIWPKERPDSKPSLDAAVSDEQLEKKVRSYLRKSQALEDYWQRPLTAEQLQAEMNRMAQHTKQPEVLRELFAALGNDPFVIAECLARPALAERLLTNWYAYDERIHGELKQSAETELQAHPAAEQMKQTSGTYTEIELIKRGSAEERSAGAEHKVKLDGREWDETVQRLAAVSSGKDGLPGGLPESARPSIAYHQNASTEASEALSVGILSALREDETRYYATAVLAKAADHLKLAIVSWPKEPLDLWLAKAGDQVPTAIAASTDGYSLPLISVSSACSDDTWTATSTTPDGRYWHTVVWTGTEMIVWGGWSTRGETNTGGRYNPGTDSWTATSTTNAPISRYLHRAIWTGSEMIVWGGSGHPGSLNTGGRYDPVADTWTPTSTTNAPRGRDQHTAVWTGSEMIVWGGYGGGSPNVNTGGRYNPVTNAWTATSTINAPTPRAIHTAVWTGSVMIIWGGTEDSGVANTGGRYNPGTNSWTATTTTNAPTDRGGHTAVWTGSEMIVWGGNGSRTGGRYNPITNSWTATSTTNAPAARGSHTAVWTGSEMIIWGGENGVPFGYFNTGGRYRPATNSWTATSTTSTPSRRYDHTAVWTGNEMIVWGGFDIGVEITNSGGRYDPSADSWVATNTTPLARDSHTSVWTGVEMIVWGGYTLVIQNTGGRYTPSTDSWATTTITNAPSARAYHTSVWSGTQMIVWGGDNGTSAGLNTGGKYNPSTDSWIATSTVNVPAARFNHTAVWSGSEMIVWGGYFFDGSYHFFNTGGRYNPSANRWTATSIANAPRRRYYHTAVWSGSEMIVWGGYLFDGSNNYLLNTGGRYNPITNSWTATSTMNAPAARELHTAVWTGNEMVVWGGYSPDYSNTGGRYNPTVNSWMATTTANAPSARVYHTAVWSGSEMIIWGGVASGSTRLNTGGRYIPITDSWTPTSLVNAPSARGGHTAVWSGSEMIVWGGSYNDSTGGRYCAQGPPAQLGNISTRAFVQTGDKVMIGGFIVQGTGPKRVIIRAIGPGLTQYGVPNALANPRLELHDAAGALIGSNDDWRTTIIGGIITSNQVGEVRDSGYAPGDGRESAIIADLAPGNYTAIVRGVNNMTGVGLVEVYDLSADTASILGNISTRSFVQTGDSVMIGGFIIQGTGAKRVIIRAIGPELTQYGVPDALANPRLELHNETGALIGSNDDWQHTIIGGIITVGQVAAIQASGHAPAAPSESAIIAELQPGNYTAIVRGVNDTTGVGLVEVYDLDR
jgi:N-acetylneuraminic acid mutarotase